MPFVMSQRGGYQSCVSVQAVWFEAEVVVVELKDRLLVQSTHRQVK